MAKDHASDTKHLILIIFVVLTW